MAAGLPIVASDWDGYRETVQHGRQGLLVPTYAPAPGQLDELACLHASGAIDYDHYLHNTCSAIAVDIEATASAFERLFTDPELRRSMGEAGRQRARAVYDWRVIIGRYAELWRKMAEVRKTADESCPRAPGRPVEPLRDDPFALFDGYATHRIDGSSRVIAARKDMPGEVAKLRQLVMGNPGRILGEEALAQLLDQLRMAPRALSEIKAGLPPDAHGRATQTVLWLKKMGLIEIEPAADPDRLPD
jgi:alpha-maltose-1-phosphate synthase